MNWDEARNLIKNAQNPLSFDSEQNNWVTLPHDIHFKCFQNLLQEVGRCELTGFEQVKSGGNNCVYKITTGEETILGKVYHRDSHDRRDRFGHEVAFLKYLESIGIKETPALISQDRTAGAVCIDWIEGSDFDSQLVPNESFWEQCFSFLKNIQIGKIQLKLKVSLMDQRQLFH